MKTHKLLVMLGTSLATQGGVASVVKVYRDDGLFDRYPVAYLATHRDGGARLKLMAVVQALFAFIGLLLRARVGLVHIHVASRASYWRKLTFVALARLFRVPVILHLHGAEFSMFYEQESGPAKRALIRWGFNSAARVVVLSSAWKAWVESIGVRAPVRAIHNPVVLPPASAWEQRQPGNVLFLGRLGQRKGCFDMIEAAALLDQQKFQLLLGGDGEVEEVRRRADKLGIGAAVQLLGWVDAASRQVLLGQAWLYCLPSYNEGLPMSLLEAMAAGLPVITTPVGGIPDAVTDGVEGFLVQAGDVDAIRSRMAQMLDNRELAQQMGAAARRKVEQHFSSTVILPQVESLYRELGVLPV